jgi:hypothetical protein
VQGYDRGGRNQRLREDFATADDFRPVRDDPEFIEALDDPPPNGRA